MLDYRLNESSPDIQTQQKALPPQEIQPKINRGSKSPFLKWFYDLPISRKQLIAMLASELVSLVALGLGARWIIETGLRTQLLDQAKSEVAVTEINYNIKVNQMGFGFRGQADNPAIIAAAKAQTLDTDLQTQVKQILQNEIKARKIEYATLVGKDLRIIVNGNANRQGEIFNPNNLVKEIFRDPRQIKASAIVSWAELAKEAPPLPSGFENQDALIRYTVTPVRDPATKTIIGALVSGDIVNDKLPIVKGTLKAFGGGYSAVYLHKPTGEFTSTTALDQGKAKNIDQAQSNIDLPNSSLLAAAAAANGKPVTGRMEIGGQTYTLAAIALPNIFKEEPSGPVPVATTGDPVAILVRGTPETALNQLLNQSLLAELAVFLLALLVIGGWALILRRAITKPIEQLQRTTQEFALGDRQARTLVFANDEVGQLAATFNKMADNIETNLEAIRHQEELRLQEQETATRQQSEYAEQQRIAKEKLQKRALELLMEVDPISKGDLTIRASVTEDEIGTVADSYNATVSSLRKIVTQVQTAASQVAATTSTSVASVQELSAEALRQAQEITTALDRIQEMSNSIQAVAINAEQAEAAVQQATQTLEEGDAAMNQTVDGILAIRETVTETSKKVKLLGESTQRISKVVNLIGRFAAQTNLLALKASIEAARAGEEGRGFAVLADEVRELARQSAQATAEVETLVADIQTETNEVVAAMEAGTLQVAEGTLMVDQTRQSLNKIAATSTQVSALITAIASAAVSQSQASESVTQTISDVAAIAQHTSSEATVVSASFKELLAVATELQASVGQFKVS